MVPALIQGALSLSIETSRDRKRRMKKYPVTVAQIASHQKTCPGATSAGIFQLMRKTTAPKIMVSGSIAHTLRDVSDGSSILPCRCFKKNFLTGVYQKYSSLAPEFCFIYVEKPDRVNGVVRHLG